MKKKPAAAIAVPVTLLSAGIGVALRCYQLCYAMDESGLPQRGSRMSTVLTVFLLAVTAALAWISSRLTKRERFEENFSNALFPVAASCMFSVLLLAGNVLLLIQPDHTATVVVLLGIAAALTQLGMQAAWRKGTTPHPLLPTVTCIYLIVKLILDFKRWGNDPVILDYCFKLLAEICSMLAVYHYIGFCFAKGRRRIAVFWCCMSVVLCAMSLPDGFLAGDSPAETLIYSGLGLWLFMNSLQLLTTVSNSGKYLKKTE